MWKTTSSCFFLIAITRSCFCYGYAINPDDDVSVMARFAIDATKADGIGTSPSTITAFLCLEKDLDHHRNYYIIDIDCPGAFDILIQANSAGMFTAPTKWLLLQDLRNGGNVSDKLAQILNREIFQLFENMSIFPDSDVVIGQKVRSDFIKLISIYRPSNARKLVIEDRGYWKNGDGITLNSTRISSVRRKNLRGTPLKSCLVIADPDSINHLTDFENRHIDTIAKVNYPWVLFLVEIMNATVSFEIVESWGYRDSNNTWSGMIGMLDRKEIDLGGTALFFTQERTDVIQYISLYTPTRAKFIFRRPPLSYVSNVFVLPFRPTVWIASIVFLILVSVLLYVAWKWEWHATPTEVREKLLLTGNTARISLSDNILIIIGAVSQQGSTFEPRRFSTRIIVLMLFIALLSLYTSYTANIVALLQSSTGSINTLDKLLRSSLKIGVADNVYNRYYFSTFQDPVRKAIYEQKVVPKGQKPAWMSMEEGVRRLRKGRFAFHAESGSAYKLVQETFQEEEKCGIEEIDYLHVLDPLLAIQKRSPYLEIIKVGALKLRESGLQTRHIKRLYTKKPTCNGHTSFVSVGLIDVYAAFATIGWGALLSLIVLLFEILWYRQKVQRGAAMKKSSSKSGRHSIEVSSDWS
ncbi:probable glutamate receptor [Diprion similis]|uniref:probable glutamate receptor n=1 Tax=Diprion similis TaxID=362088 RepID=UPI001EF87FD3|nr:probable glutamate receptor [Diprion similis]